MLELIHDPSFGTLLFSALSVWPLRRILLRAGLSPLYAWLIFVPVLGMLLVVMVLGHRSWPNLPPRPVPLPPKQRRTA